MSEKKSVRGGEQKQKMRNKAIYGSSACSAQKRHENSLLARDIRSWGVNSLEARPEDGKDGYFNGENNCGDARNSSLEPNWFQIDMPSPASGHENMIMVARTDVGH